MLLVPIMLNYASIIRKTLPYPQLAKSQKKNDDLVILIRADPPTKCDGHTPLLIF